MEFLQRYKFNSIIASLEKNDFFTTGLHKAAKKAGKPAETSSATRVSKRLERDLDVRKSSSRGKKKDSDDDLPTEPPAELTSAVDIEEVEIGAPQPPKPAPTPKQTKPAPKPTSVPSSPRPKVPAPASTPSPALRRIPIDTKQVISSKDADAILSMLGNEASPLLNEAEEHSSPLDLSESPAPEPSSSPSLHPRPVYVAPKPKVVWDPFESAIPEVPQPTAHPHHYPHSSQSGHLDEESFGMEDQHAPQESEFDSHHAGVYTPPVEERHIANSPDLVEEGSSPPGEEPLDGHQEFTPSQPVRQPGVPYEEEDEEEDSKRKKRLSFSKREATPAPQPKSSSSTAMPMGGSKATASIPSQALKSSQAVMHAAVETLEVDPTTKSTILVRN